MPGHHVISRVMKPWLRDARAKAYDCKCHERTPKYRWPMWSATVGMAFAYKYRFRAD